MSIAFAPALARHRRRARAVGVHARAVGAGTAAVPSPATVVAARPRRLVAGELLARAGAQARRADHPPGACAGRVPRRPRGRRLPEQLGNRLVAASRDARQDFEFFAVPDSAINAFALPGGYIGVNTGLILLAQNESELASVLAHEITHVTQRHIARMMQAQQNSLLMSLATLALAMLAARARRQLVGRSGAGGDRRPARR